ncbi:hypothetical protein L1987_33528 [Smallanthus sonchifolius]|uniref:Uncharacterized protein n=1 Tax=Smallanthus sonchifolius TaxID=185202 RepID=A0ACB9HRN2_9ASTR|nr:hypothetical protein L1987_33528 [Smallanthus sonchifolius]
MASFKTHFPNTPDDTSQDRRGRKSSRRNDVVLVWSKLNPSCFSPLKTAITGVFCRCRDSDQMPNHIISQSPSIFRAAFHIFRLHLV